MTLQNRSDGLRMVVPDDNSNIQTPVIELVIEPVGAHSSGLAISSATVLTRPAGATKILIQALTQNVRFTLDGTLPTAASGFQLKAADPPLIIPLGSRTRITVIQETATASLQYQFCN